MSEKQRAGEFGTVVAKVFWVDDRIPEGVRRCLRPLLIRHASLVPGWCGHIDVFWKDEDTDRGAAAIEAFYDYRRANLWIYPNFITRPDRQEYTVVHELFHLLTEPWYNTTRDLRAFLDEHHPESKKLIAEEMRHAMEQTVCDMADAYLRSTW
jgi:hypothetical protein